MADSDTIVSAWNTSQNDQDQQQHQPQQAPQETQPRVPRRVCAACRRRKVGCDKKQPCQHCKKSGTECVYPPDNQSSEERQVLRDTELLERLHRLEPMLKTLASCMEQGALLPSVMNPSAVPENLLGHRENASENTFASSGASPAPPTPPHSVGSGSTFKQPECRLTRTEQPKPTRAQNSLGQPSPTQDADLAGNVRSNPSNTAGGGGSSQGISPREMSGLVESPYGTSTGKLVRDDGRQRYVSGTFWEALHTEVTNLFLPLCSYLLNLLISSMISTTP